MTVFEPEPDVPHGKGPPMVSMSSLKRLVALGVVALLLVGAGVVVGEEKKLSGTKHDVAMPNESPCTYCHIPQDPKGELLWARHPNRIGSSSDLKPFCFSCHDGTVTTRGGYVFDASRPQHLNDPGLNGQTCGRCHDPHNADYDKFIKVPGDASFCQSCHLTAGPGDGHFDVDARARGIHPVDSEWSPDAGDFSGTRLWNPDGTGPGDVVKCMTCHSPHGGEPNTDINTMVFRSKVDSSAPLCANCHSAAGGD
jgi:predicted CXXCH cytochrome family protein